MQQKKLGSNSKGDNKYRLSHYEKRGDISFIARERRDHILSRVSAASE